MSVRDVFFRAIRETVFGCKEAVSNVCDFDALYNLAKKQDFAHIVAAYINSNKIKPDKSVLDKFTVSYNNAVFSSAKQEFVLSEIKRIFTDGKIDFIALKGSVIRFLYNESFMRTSRDIDVLIKECDLKKACSILLENGFVQKSDNDYHDISFYFSSVHLELHFNIKENIQSVDKILSNAWEYTEKIGEYEYAETKDFFVFHHMAHMLYHVYNGGCGVKPFVDLYILKCNGYCDGSLLNVLLSESGLLTFYNKCLELSEVWFGGRAHDNFTETFEKYILFGGAFGVKENADAVKNAKSKNRFTAVLRYLFPSYYNMTALYPFLNKNKLCAVLLPFCYIHRLLKGVFKKRKKGISNVKGISSGNSENTAKTAELLKELGLE